MMPRDTAAIHRMAGSGLTAARISALIGMPINDVYAVMSAYEQSGGSLDDLATEADNRVAADRLLARLQTAHPGGHEDWRR